MDQWPLARDDVTVTVLGSAMVAATAVVGAPHAIPLPCPHMRPSHRSPRLPLPQCLLALLRIQGCLLPDSQPGTHELVKGRSFMDQHQSSLLLNLLSMCRIVVNDRSFAFLFDRRCEL
jgi:hypothetical protein